MVPQPDSWRAIIDTPTDDLRIGNARPLTTPWVLAEELPLPASLADHIAGARRAIEDILAHKDPRMLAIVGPCSVHDPAALLDFAHQFKALCEPLADAVFPVLRVYFEKPRTVMGWKGLINDPGLDGSFHINRGLHLARKVLLDVNDLGLPAASEFLDTTFGQYYAELVSFGAIGARTVESQIHRELASGLSMPVGFKNGTGGQIDVAIDAIRSARHGHWFPSLTKEGTPAILKSEGNPHGYLILRGGKQSGPNYQATAVQQAAEALAENALTGVAAGAAIGGMRPIYFHNRPDFLLLAMDQLANHAAKWRYMFGGAVNVPLVIWACIGRGWGSAAQHSQALQGLFMHIPGLKLVMPSTCYDAKGLMLSAISDDNPVVIIEHRYNF